MQLLGLNNMSNCIDGFLCSVSTGVCAQLLGRKFALQSQAPRHKLQGSRLFQLPQKDGWKLLKISWGIQTFVKSIRRLWIQVSKIAE